MNVITLDMTYVHVGYMSIKVQASHDLYPWRNECIDQPPTIKAIQEHEGDLTIMV